MANPTYVRMPERVAVVRALPGLGDVLCAIPALRALRATLPGTEVVLIGLPHSRLLMDRFPQYVDRTMDLPGWPGLPETKPDLKRIPAFLAAALAEPFDLAIQMHGNGSVTNQITSLLGASVTAGYYLPGTWCPDHDTFLPWTGRQSEPRRWLELVAHLGFPLRGEYLEFPLQEEDVEGFERLANIHDLVPGEYVCIHPGSSTEGRRWRADRFASVADALAERGYRIVLTGAAGDIITTTAVRQAMCADAVDLTGETDLGTLGALLREARLLVCNDTGVSHLAAALGAPSVVVFTGSDPARWAPANRRLHRIVLDAPLGHRAGAWTAASNAVETVLREADDLMDCRAPSLSASSLSTLSNERWS